MIPPYTFVYPQKTLTQAESPQTMGQRLAVRPSGDVRGGAQMFPTTGTWNGLGAGPDGLGFFFPPLIPLIAGGYAIDYACKNGYLEGDDCKDIGITPGKNMPGSCPNEFKLDGQCYCPVDAETPSGGCAYPGAGTVDGNGALPIGGGTGPAPAASNTLWILGGLAAAGAAVYFLRKK